MEIQKIEQLIKDLQNTDIKGISHRIDKFTDEIKSWLSTIEVFMSSNRAYRVLSGFEDIEVNALGDFRWFGSKRKFNLHTVWGGRYSIRYKPSYDGPLKSLSPYKMVATLFVPNPNNFCFVKTIDGDDSNFAASNLKWVKCSGG